MKHYYAESVILAVAVVICAAFVHCSISRLADRERDIITLRFFEGKTQMEVASEIGISQAQVSRIEKSALNTIKKSI